MVAVGFSLCFFKESQTKVCGYQVFEKLAGCFGMVIKFKKQIGNNMFNFNDFKNKDNIQKRKHLFKLFFALIIVIFGIALVYWYLVLARFVSTDNAYVAAEIAQVTPFTSGIVQAINVTDTKKVKTGDPLVLIDDIDAKLALERTQSTFDKAKADMEKATLDLKRRQTLVTLGAVSAEELTNTQNAYKSAKANFNLTNAALKQAKIDLERTVIRAPIDGIIAKRDVQLGQRIVAGTPLLSIVPLGKVYVNANFKENQLKKVKIGQTVKLISDLYGSNVVFHGKIKGFSGGTGAAFALIPAQNATGNWIKVVQRLPVRIELNTAELEQHPLQVGLSMSVSVNTGKH